MSSPQALTIALVAGEHSGDILGAGLVRALKLRYPDACFVGIGGPRMQAEGFESLFPMEELAVMGLVEVVKHLPRLLGIKKALVERFSQEKPAVFIGIDAPDFNLRVEKDLRTAGIKTVHYVSPSVWAWRQGRIKGIAKAVDHMLCLLPFEKQFYDQQQPELRVPATFVGHPLADEIPLQNPPSLARQQLGLPLEGQYIGLLPGSRGGEVAKLAEPFIRTAKLLYQQDPSLKFIVPLVSQARREQFEPILKQLAPELPVTLIDGHSREVMAASDAILLASGTAALEAMLVGRPMVVGYIINQLTYVIAKQIVKTKFVSLPNLLAERELVPEVIQSEATPENLAHAMQKQLSRAEELHSEFKRLHQSLQQDASERAAEAVAGLLEA